MSEVETAGPAPGRRAASLPLVVGMALLGASFGAVSGLHVYALLSGHAQFLVTKEIEQFLIGQSLWSSPVPADRMGLWELCHRLPILGGSWWLRGLTLALAAGCATGILVIINPRLWWRLRSRDIAVWRVLVAVIVTAGVLHYALLPLPDEVMRTSFPFTRAALAGGLTWLLWHRRGWLHTTTEPPSVWVILGQLVCGALVGLTAHAFTRHDRTIEDLRMVEDWLNAGYYHRAVWGQLALYCIGLHAWGGLLAATLACFLGQPGTSLPARLRSVAPALVLLLLSSAFARLYYQRVWLEAYQFRTPLPQVVGLTEPQRPEQKVILIAERDDQPMPLRLTVGLSWVGLPVSETVTELVRHKLQAQDGRTSVAKQLWFQLHDSATWRWQPTEALRIARQQLASPSSTPVFGTCLLEALHRLPPSAAAKAALDELLAGQAWGYPSKEARAEVMRLAWRFGRLEEALPLLGPDEQEEFEKLRRQPPPGQGNTVSGRLTLEGKALADVQVGLVRDEDWEVLMRASQRWLTAWQQRLVIASSTTSADGRFEFPDLFDGSYHLLLRVPFSLVPRNGGVSLQGFGGTVTVAGGNRRELGTIALRTWVLAEPGEGVAGPGTFAQPQAL